MSVFMFAISAAVAWVVHARSLQHDSQILRLHHGVMNVYRLYCVCARACSRWCGNGAVCDELNQP